MTARRQDRETGRSAPRLLALPATVAAVATVAILVYANSLPNGFTYDDVWVVERNPLVSEGSSADAFTQPYWPDGLTDLYRPVVTYRPVTMFSLQTNHRLFGPGPLSYHAFNVLLHALASALVAVFTGRFLAHDRGGRHAALATGLLFAVHPVHTEAVAGVVGRAELLAAVFYLAALVVVLGTPGPGRLGHGLGTPEPGRRGHGLVPTASFGAFAPLVVFALGLAALGSKEHAVTLPAAIALLALFRADLRTRSVALAAGAAAAAVVVYLTARAAVLGAGLDVGPAETYWDGGRPGVRLATALVGFTKYVQLFVFPHPLSAEYSFDQIPLASSALDPRALAGLALGFVLGAILVASVVRSFASRPGAGWPAGIGLFLVTLAPVANVAFPVNVIVAERLLYLPSVGLSLAAGAAFATFPRSRKLAGAILVLVVTVLGARTVARNPVWRSDSTLFEQTVLDAPRCARAWAKLGEIRSAAGRSAPAREAYERALSIDPGEYAAYDGLGHLALESGDTARALAWFERGAQVHPGNPAPFYNAGLAHLRADRPEAAIDRFEAALRLDPASVLARDALAGAWQALAVQRATDGELAGADSALVAGISRAEELGASADAMRAMLREIREARGR